MYRIEWLEPMRLGCKHAGGLVDSYLYLWIGEAWAGRVKVRVGKLLSAWWGFGSLHVGHSVALSTFIMPDVMYLLGGPIQLYSLLSKIDAKRHDTAHRSSRLKSKARCGGCCLAQCQGRLEHPNEMNCTTLESGAPNHEVEIGKILTVTLQCLATCQHLFFTSSAHEKSPELSILRSARCLPIR